MDKNKLKRKQNPSETETTNKQLAKKRKPDDAIEVGFLFRFLQFDDTIIPNIFFSYYSMFLFDRLNELKILH